MRHGAGENGDCLVVDFHRRFDRYQHFVPSMMQSLVSSGGSHSGAFFFCFYHADAALTGQAAAILRRRRSFPPVPHRFPAVVPAPSFLILHLAIK